MATINDDNRGVIRNREYANQVKDYSGLRYGNITPTDLDGMIDFQNLAFVFIELKFANAELPYGQRLALERLTDDIESTGKAAITIVAEHNTSRDKDIDVAHCKVVEARIQGEWKSFPDNFNVRWVIDYFRAKYVFHTL